MKYEYFFVADANGGSNCVIRTFCKMFNKEYDEVCDELSRIANENNLKYNDKKCFEIYMSNYCTYKIKCDEGIKVRDLCLDSGSYAIFCWDRNEFYHMITIIDGVLYDKSDKSLDLYVIDLYKQNEKFR